MRIYIISDDFRNSVAASNIIGATGHGSIISETKSEDVRDLLSDLKNNIDSGFDLILLMCHSAKDVAISANKLSGVRAVVCKDQEDAMESMSSTRANVVIVDTSKAGRRELESIVQGLVSEEEPSAAQAPVKARQTQPRQQQQQAPQQMPVAKGPGLFSGVKGKLASAEQKMSRGARAAEKSTVASDLKDTVDSVRKKGVLKALKESFGLDEQ